jgi:hypothetical protein
MVLMIYLLYRRETPATTIPTKFVHRPHVLVPELSFPMASKFNDMVAICRRHYENLIARSRNGDVDATEEINLNKNTQPHLFARVRFFFWANLNRNDSHVPC